MSILINYFLIKGEKYCLFSNFIWCAYSRKKIKFKLSFKVISYIGICIFIIVSASAFIGHLSSAVFCTVVGWYKQKKRHFCSQGALRNKPVLTMQWGQCCGGESLGEEMLLIYLENEWNPSRRHNQNGRQRNLWVEGRRKEKQFLADGIVFIIAGNTLETHNNQLLAVFGGSNWGVMRRETRKRNWAYYLPWLTSYKWILKGIVEGQRTIKRKYFWIFFFWDDSTTQLSSIIHIMIIKS